MRKDIIVKTEIITKLRDVLVTLYPDDSSIRRVIHDSGLNLSHIDLNSTPINTWHSILTEAEKSGRVDALLGVAKSKSEYGDNEKLRDACDAYHQSASQTGRSDNNSIGDPNNLNQSQVVNVRERQYRMALNWDGSTSLRGFDLSYRDLSKVNLRGADH